MTNVAPPSAPPAPKRDSDLPEFLMARARGASDLRLAADTTVGLVAVLVTLIWPFPFGFVALTAGGCLLGFGVWGIADRELSERGSSVTPRQARLLGVVKILATVVGAVSAAALMVGTMAVLIGRVIS